MAFGEDGEEGRRAEARAIVQAISERMTEKEAIAILKPTAAKATAHDSETSELHFPLESLLFGMIALRKLKLPFYYDRLQYDDQEILNRPSSASRFNVTVMVPHEKQGELKTQGLEFNRNPARRQTAALARNEPDASTGVKQDDSMDITAEIASFLKSSSGKVDSADPQFLAYAQKIAAQEIEAMTPDRAAKLVGQYREKTSLDEIRFKVPESQTFRMMIALNKLGAKIENITREPLDFDQHGNEAPFVTEYRLSVRQKDILETLTRSQKASLALRAQPSVLSDKAAIDLVLGLRHCIDTAFSNSNSIRYNLWPKAAEKMVSALAKLGVTVEPQDVKPENAEWYQTVTLNQVALKTLASHGLNLKPNPGKEPQL